MARGRVTYLFILSCSFITLLAERIWDSFWAAISVLLLFIALAFFNFFILPGPGLHLALLAVFIAAIGGTGFYFGKPFKFPKQADAERAIERESGLDHRPLAALKDKPSDAADTARALWQSHLAKLGGIWRQLKIYRPKPTAAQDTYHLRHAALALALIGLLVARAEAPARLWQAVTPDVSAGLHLQPVTVDAWITPPDYTGSAPVFLAAATLSTKPVAAGADITVPENSLLKVRVSGYHFSPRLSTADGHPSFKEPTPRNYTVEIPLHQSGKVSLSHFFLPLGSWQVNVTKDMPPEISIITTGSTGRDALKITYHAKDDYSIKKITAAIRPEADKALQQSVQGIDFDIPVSVSDKAELSHVEDLTYSPLAGKNVTLTLSAEDAAGQVSVSAPVSLALPERHFRNEVAARLALERKRLIDDNNAISRRLSFTALANIAAHPDYYKDDKNIFLNLVVAVKRLVGEGDDPRSVATVEAMLWDLALRIEDGGLSQASDDLSQALQKLSAALKDKNMSKAELQELMGELQKKMGAYLQSLARDLQQKLAAQGKALNLPPEIADKFMQKLDFSKMVEAMRALLQGDSPEQMQKLAEMLKNSIDNLDVSKLDTVNAAQQRAMQSLQDLQDLITQQQALHDKTAKMAQGQDAAAAKKEQAEIRAKLGDIVRKIAEIAPKIPENFANADQAMKNALKSLDGGQPKAAADAQKTALDELKKGMDQSASQMAEAMQQMMLSLGFSPGDQGGANADPLGRNGNAAGGDVNIPEEKERRRVQEIIQELRSRSNDYQRPKTERDYIDRLLDQFN